MDKIKKILAVLAVLNLIILGSRILVNSSESNSLGDNILILYYQSNSQTADYWRGFLERYEYNVSTLPVQIILSNPELLKNFDLIILDNSTNNINGDLLTVDECRLIADQEVPIIVNGFAGWLILKLSEFNLMKLYDKTSMLKVSLEDYKLNIFHTPYEIEFINQSSFLTVKITEYYYNSTIFLPAEINMLKTYFYRYSDCAMGKYSGYINNPNIFFSFIYTPTILSANGEKIYINLVECALSRSLERERTVLTLQSPQKARVNEMILVEAKLLDSFLNPLSDRRVNLLINGDLYATNITDFNGSASFPIIFSKASAYEVTVTYQGDFEYSNCSANRVILVERTYTKILLSFEKDVASESFTVNLQLLDEREQPLSNQSIHILVNGVRIQELITDEDGKIIYRVCFGENLKKVRVEFKYEGNEIYEASSRICELSLETNSMLDLAVPIGLTAIAGCAGLLIIFLKKSNRCVTVFNL